MKRTPDIEALISRARRSAVFEDDSPDNLFSMSASKGDQIMGDFLVDVADALERQEDVVKAAESIFAFILTRSVPPSLERLTKEIEPLGKAFVALDAPLERKKDMTGIPDIEALVARLINHSFGTDETPNIHDTCREAANALERQEDVVEAAQRYTKHYDLADSLPVGKRGAAEWDKSVVAGADIRREVKVLDAPSEGEG